MRRQREAYFNISKLRNAVHSEFVFKVLLAARKIPRGRVASYKQLAYSAGYRNASRAVGRALARNPYLIKIPCHRVVYSDGAIGGFKKGKTFKRKLLEKEGIVFDRKGRILKRCFIVKRKTRLVNGREARRCYNRCRPRRVCFGDKTEPAWEKAVRN